MKKEKNNLKMTEEEYILVNSGSKVNECACAICQNMCKTCPCIGLPNEILAIAKAGFASKLDRSVWAAAVKYNVPPVYMIISPKTKEYSNECSFLNEGKCQLHDLGLKPLEGKLADCKRTRVQPGQVPHSWLIAKMWELESNQPVIKEIEELIGPDPNFYGIQNLAKIMYT